MGALYMVGLGVFTAVLACKFTEKSREGDVWNLECSCGLEKGQHAFRRLLFLDILYYDMLKRSKILSLHLNSSALQVKTSRNIKLISHEFDGRIARARLGFEVNMSEETEPSLLECFVAGFDVNDYYKDTRMNRSLTRLHSTTLLATVTAATSSASSHTTPGTTMALFSIRAPSTLQYSDATLTVFSLRKTTHPQNLPQSPSPTHLLKWTNMATPLTSASTEMEAPFTKLSWLNDTDTIMSPVVSFILLVIIIIIGVFIVTGSILWRCIVNKKEFQVYNGTDKLEQRASLQMGIVACQTAIHSGSPGLPVLPSSEQDAGYSPLITPEIDNVPHIDWSEENCRPSTNLVDLQDVRQSRHKHTGYLLMTSCDDGSFRRHPHTNAAQIDCQLQEKERFNDESERATTTRVSNSRYLSDSSPSLNGTVTGLLVIQPREGQNAADKPHTVSYNVFTESCTAYHISADSVMLSRNLSSEPRDVRCHSDAEPCTFEDICAAQLCNAVRKIRSEPSNARCNTRYNIPVEPTEIGYNIPVEPTEIGYSMSVEPTEIGYNIPVEPTEIGYIILVEPTDIGYLSVENTDIGYNIPVEHTDIGYNIPLKHTDIGYNIPLEHTDIGYNIPLEHTDIGCNIPLEPTGIGYSTLAKPYNIRYNIPVEPYNVGFDIPVQPYNVGFDISVESCEQIHQSRARVDYISNSDNQSQINRLESFREIEINEIKTEYETLCKLPVSVAASANNLSPS